MSFLAVLIGLYPLMYFLMDVDLGLLSTKSQVLLDDRLWQIAFYGHIGLGGVALMIGWTQFHAVWRNRRRNQHRAIGKLYVLSALLSALCSLYLAFSATGGWIAGMGFGLLGALWFSTTLLAFRSIKKGRMQDHEKWMLYSYALCFAAVTLRIWLPFLSSILDFIQAYRIVAWLCWLPNLWVAWKLSRSWAN